MKDYKPRNHLKYMGSKTVYAKEIAWHIRDAHPGGEFVEVFHGGGAITAQLKPRVAYDGNPCLKSFFDHIKTNPVLRPMEKPEWLRHKEELNQNDPRMAFAAFGNSFMGVSFNCFEQNSFDHTPLSNGIQKTEFVTADFKDLDFEGKVIYCDPPYKSTHGYNARGGGGLKNSTSTNLMHG